MHSCRHRDTHIFMQVKMNAHIFAGENNNSVFCYYHFENDNSVQIHEVIHESLRCKETHHKHTYAHTHTHHACKHTHTHTHTYTHIHTHAHHFYQVAAEEVTRKKVDEEAAARKRAEEERERVKKEAEGAAQKVYTYMRTLTVQRFVHTCMHACIHSFIHRSLHIK